MATIGTVTLPDVQSETQIKSTMLFQMPIPTEDSDKAIILDYFGMTTRITINGIVTGVDATHVTFINEIDSLMSGLQKGITFVSSKPGVTDKIVYLERFQWSVNAADVSKINYSIDMIEGDST